MKCPATTTKGVLCILVLLVLSEASIVQDVIPQNGHQHSDIRRQTGRPDDNCHLKFKTNYEILYEPCLAAAILRACVAQVIAESTSTAEKDAMEERLNDELSEPNVQLSFCEGRKYSGYSAKLGSRLKSAQEEDEDNNLSDGGIAGVVIAVVVGTIILIVAGVYFSKKKETTLKKNNKIAPLRQNLRLSGVLGDDPLLPGHAGSTRRVAHKGLAKNVRPME